MIKAKDLMTSPVVSARPQSTVAEVAALLYERQISAAWWSRLLAADRSLETYVRSHARRVADLMTREVVTAAPDDSLAEVAALLEARRVKRVPVVRAGRVVGMVSRSDLVRALASATRPAQEARPAGDPAIRAHLLRELERQPWWRGRTSQVAVEDGTVVYSGTIDDEAERAAARVAAETVPGVRRVEDRRLLFRDLPSMV